MNCPPCGRLRLVVGHIQHPRPIEVFLNRVGSTKVSNMDRDMAQKTWEMSNNIELVQSSDEIYKYDKKQQHEILQAKPWTKE